MTTAKANAILGAADLRRIPDEELQSLHRACTEAISAMVHELEQRGAFAPIVRIKAKAAHSVHTRRHRA